MILVCCSVGFVRVVGWVGDLFSVALKVSINDERHWQLILDVFELDGCFFFGECNLLRALFVAEMFVIV